MNHNCPHNNRGCNTAQKCTPCRGNGVLKDGEKVRRPMLMMDSMQRELAARMPDVGITDEIRAQARADHDAWMRGQQTQPAYVNDTEARNRQAFDSNYRDAMAAKEIENQRALQFYADKAAEVQRLADEFTAERRAREAAARSTPRDRAYAEYCDRLDYRGRG